MGNIISLSTPDLDWDVLARRVERMGSPVWLELNGTIQGVLLPAADARRLMGCYLLPAEGPAAGMPVPPGRRPQRNDPE